MNKLFTLILLLLSAAVSAQTVSGVQAKSYIVTELDGTVLLEHDSKTSRPIASITKLLITEQLVPQLNASESVTILSEDLASNKTSVRVNSKLSQEQLLHLALISSNNQAIYALTRSHGMEQTISSVNSSARERGLQSISIEEPSGLSKNNVATAEDLAKFVSIVSTTDVAKISVEPNTSVNHTNFKSTNPLLGKPGWNFGVSKTGFTHPAGGCLVSLVEMGGRQVIVVILGSTNVVSRWKDLIKIRSYISHSDNFWTIENSSLRFSKVKKF